MTVLHLTLKKKWFDMVSDPNPDTRKDEEYREIKDYWVKRLGSFIEWRMESYIQADISDSQGNGYKLNDFDAICFHWGYKKNHPTTLRECKGIDIGEAKPEWSDNWQGEVFRIKLGNIISTNFNQ